ncbi:MAG: hypothetical protein FJW95_11500 [Actinobacteria bacterium]|nr:hypothetical protein [Actinomycetota bacterium]
MASERDERMLAAIRRVLDAGERIEARGWCWAAVERRRVPLLFLRRRRFDAFVTDRRLVLIARSRGPLDPSDVKLVKHFDALVLDAQHQRPTLLQQRLRTDAGLALVVEWPHRSREVGHIVSDEVPRARVRPAA